MPPKAAGPAPAAGAAPHGIEIGELQAMVAAGINQGFALEGLAADTNEDVTRKAYLRTLGGNLRFTQQTAELYKEAKELVTAMSLQDRDFGPQSPTS